MKICLTVLIIMMALWLSKVSAQIIETKLVPIGGQLNETFGYSVASDSNYLIIGAPGRSAPNMMYYGSAYVYENTGGTWTEQSRLVASDSAELAHFGHSVSISGDFILIGAYLDDQIGTNAGAAYIFKRDTSGQWIEYQKLLASDGGDYGKFGWSVSLFGDHAIIGAPTYFDSVETGAAYIFKWNDTLWVEEAKLVPGNGIGTSPAFGTSVSIYENYTIIGAPDDEALGTNVGAAYIYYNDGNGWTQQAKLHATNVNLNHWFGKSVSISGDYVVIGSPGANTSTGGAAFVFHRTDTTWTEEAMLEGNSNYGRVGHSVYIDNDYVVVGDDWDETKGSSSGCAYIFKRNGINWTFEHKLLASDGGEDDRFGWSVFLEGDQILVGAFTQYASGQYCGAVYVYNGFITGISETGKANIPVNFAVEQNYPNPFNPSTKIRFAMREGEYVELKIYDLLGREVKTLVNERKPAGRYTVQWDGTNDSGQPVASAVYLYKLTVGKASRPAFTKTRKMVLMR